MTRYFRTDHGDKLRSAVYGYCRAGLGNREPDANSVDNHTDLLIRFKNEVIDAKYPSTSNLEATYVPIRNDMSKKYLAKVIDGLENGAKTLERVYELNKKGNLPEKDDIYGIATNAASALGITEARLSKIVAELEKNNRTILG